MYRFWVLLVHLQPRHYHDDTCTYFPGLRCPYAVQNDSLATLLVRLEGILGPLPSWMISQGRYSNRYYTRSRQLYERNKSNGR